MSKHTLYVGNYAVLSASLAALQVVAAAHATEGDLMTLITDFARFVAGGAGAVIVIAMGWRGLQYLSARDNAGQVAEAKKGMFDVILALFLYLFGLVLLNALMPGGLF
ncbi:MAG TPA: hypothetical protein VLF60_00930 [Candidatus Saccharimonadales bacterium]|nr:hypothetical protein [Candidatus Saccharimonadales bacterium]